MFHFFIIGLHVWFVTTPFVSLTNCYIDMPRIQFLYFFSFGFTVLLNKTILRSFLSVKNAYRINPLICFLFSLKISILTMGFPVPSETFASVDINSLASAGYTINVHCLLPKHKSMINFKERHLYTPKLSIYHCSKFNYLISSLGYF